MKETILVFDYGAQYNQLICRRVRELGVYSELVPHDLSLAKFRKISPKGVILSGGPQSVYDQGAAGLPPWLLKERVPVLGICYGMQLLAKELKGRVTPARLREYGHAQITILKKSRLFQGVETGSSCWMSHGDEVNEPPPGFESLAESASGVLAAMGDDRRKIYGVQFHPEVTHTPFGSILLKNFLEICGCRFDWSIGSFVEEAVASIRDTVKDKGAICGVSGGIDSTVAAALVARAVGDRLHAVFVDHGLLRLGEREEVQAMLSQFSMKLHVVDASNDFLRKLKGVVDPEKKRKIIGETFIRVFEREAKKLGKNVRFLVQGTLYPDVIESSPRSSKLAHKIKTHHNVGGLPEKMGFKLIEPLRLLFKDEVREVGKTLDLPQNVIDRQPFPGPGLAVRILGGIKPQNLDLLRRADAIVREEISKSNGKSRLWQFFAVLLPVKTVGVMGDRRTYQNIAALRAVSSSDGMTADWARLPWELLERISSRIVGEVRGINRVVYDITSKPPATIEWE